MNTLKFFPKPLREMIEKNMRNAGIEKSPAQHTNFLFLVSIIVTVLFSAIFLIFKISLLYSLGVFVFMHLFFYFKISLEASNRIKKMEEIFPDVISLMSSNLRSGITIEKAFLMAARPEFDPIDKEIMKTGKEITTGQDIIYALHTMAKRIDSEKIEKVIMLIISGLKAGGNISDLLDQTSRNMKEKEVIEKKTRSTILMYVIFIFFAVGAGAPVLFGLSTVLVEIVVGLTSTIPDFGGQGSSLPFSFTKVAISPQFVIYFSIIFIIITDFISCLVIGLVNKGEGKAGLRFFVPLIVASLLLFFLVRIILSSILGDLITFF